MLRGAAAVSGPAALAGAGLAFAAEPRDASSALGWSLAGVVVAAALAGPPLAAVWRHRRPAPASNPARVTTADPGRLRRVPPRRWMAEATACVAAVAGLIVLHDQGLPPAGQADLLQHPRRTSEAVAHRLRDVCPGRPQDPYGLTEPYPWSALLIMVDVLEFMFYSSSVRKLMECGL